MSESCSNDRFSLHLAPDRIGAFAPTGHLGGDAAVGELLGELPLDLGDQPAIRFQRFEAFADHLVGVGADAKRQVLQLLAQLVHAHAAGERGIDVEGLLGGTPPRLGRHVRERAHVVQPVGQLDQQHLHIVGDRQQKLTQVLGLLCLLGDEVELLELG